MSIKSRKATPQMLDYSIFHGVPDVMWILFVEVRVVSLNVFIQTQKMVDSDGAQQTHESSVFHWFTICSRCLNNHAVFKTINIICFNPGSTPTRIWMCGSVVLVTQYGYMIYIYIFIYIFIYIYVYIPFHVFNEVIIYT